MFIELSILLICLFILCFLDTWITLKLIKISDIKDEGNPIVSILLESGVGYMYMLKFIAVAFYIIIVFTIYEHTMIILRGTYFILGFYTITVISNCLMYRRLKYEI